ncbi:MAG: tRNA lysidine(34) synthetase TilS, partial [Verrucomicrobiales bacterium]
MIDLRASLDPARTYLLGLSGGRDSVALLHLLHQQGFAKIIPCHLNHQLRGAEAEKDAHFVAELCQSLAYPLESASCDVAARAESKKNSLETAARSARRQFFARCAEKFACPRLLLAHHADDQAETLLFNLLRGSASLRGMSPESRQVIGGQD